MRRSVIFFSIALGTLGLLAGEAWAAKMTQQQVKKTCGSGLQSGGGVIGCSKKCGSEICDYSCGGPEGSGCRSHVVSGPEKARVGGSGPKGPRGTLTAPGPLETKPGFSPQGPAATGSPGGAPPPPPPVILR